MNKIYSLHLCPQNSKNSKPLSPQSNLINFSPNEVAPQGTWLELPLVPFSQWKSIFFQGSCFQKLSWGYYLVPFFPRKFFLGATWMWSPLRPPSPQGKFNSPCDNLVGVTYESPSRQGSCSPEELNWGYHLVAFSIGKILFSLIIHHLIPFFLRKLLPKATWLGLPTPFPWDNFVEYSKSSSPP